MQSFGQSPWRKFAVKMWPFIFTLLVLIITGVGLYREIDQIDLYKPCAEADKVKRERDYLVRCDPIRLHWFMTAPQPP